MLSLIDILLILIIAAAVFFAAKSIIRNKGCGCSGKCDGCTGCHTDNCKGSGKGK